MFTSSIPTGTRALRKTVTTYVKAGHASLSRSWTSLSYGSPESDFSRPTVHEIVASYAKAQHSTSATSLSFSTPNSDFFAPMKETVLNSAPPGQMESFNVNISFGTPYADAVSPSHLEIKHVNTAAQDHPTRISFSTPFSDFSAPSSDLIMKYADQTTNTANESGLFTQHLSESFTSVSFSSPYSDFVATNAHELNQIENYVEPSVSISYATPFSDFAAPDSAHILSAPVDSENTHAYISFSTPLADFTAPNIHDIDQHSIYSAADVNADHISFASPYADVMSASATMDFQGEDSEAAILEDTKLFEELPKSLQAAIATSSESTQARVITEALPPFRITYVNDAWVGLCGFSSEEAVGKTLNILQGEKTKASVLDRLHARTTAGHLEEHMSFQLLNYKKNGQEFTNHLRIVPLENKEKEGEVTHFLGVLEDLAVTWKQREEQIMLQRHLQH